MATEAQENFRILKQPETPGKIRNVVLEKDGEDQLDRSREKSITES
jgi:hypothetical protein